MQPCGTWAAYMRHVKNGEVRDDACKAANAAHVREWRRGKVQEKRHAQRAADLRTEGEIK